MGNTLMSLLVKLGLDSGDYNKGLTDSEGKAITSSKKMAASFTTIGKSMTKVGGIMSLTMTAPIVAGMGDAINAASNLSESINKTKVVFQENGDAILKWSENSAISFGLSKAQALDAAGGFGAMFGAMGVGADETLKMSEGLVQLAADMGSLYNVDPSEMLEKLRSGMAGEAEPLRIFGINISEANIKAQALKMGLGDTTNALTDQEKALARFALIQDQATIAQGDFKNTSDGLANTTRTTKAELENLSAAMGTELLPIISEVSKTILPLLQSFNNLDSSTKSTIIGIVLLIAVLGPLITIIGTVSTAIGWLITFFGAGGAGAMAFGAAGTFLSGTVLPALAAGIAAIGIPVLLLVAAIGILIGVIITFGSTAKNTINDIRDIIATKIQEGINKLKELGGAFEGIATSIQTVHQWIINFQNQLLGLKPPPWLTPGSPTPFELGLRGISKEMASLTRTQLPNFSAGLDLQPGAIGSIAAKVSGGGENAALAGTSEYGGPSADEIGQAVAVAMMQYGLAG